MDTVRVKMTPLLEAQIAALEAEAARDHDSFTQGVLYSVVHSVTYGYSLQSEIDTWNNFLVAPDKRGFAWFIKTRHIVNLLKKCADEAWEAHKN